MTMIGHSAPSTAEARRVTLFGFAATVSFYICSGAPTPLYHLYQEHMHLTALTITMIFAIYVLGLLVALLVFGSLSDHLGRKPMIFASLLLNLVALTAFATATTPEMLLFARLFQGLATGTAIPALGAAILDTDHQRGPVLNSVSAFIGLMVGSLLAGLLVTFAPAPERTIYYVLLAMTAIQLLFLATIRETSARRPGALAALKPKFVVPAAVVPTMLRVSPVNIAGWALGGFYLSLMPTLVSLAIGFYSPLIGGAVVATLMLVAVIAAFTSRNTRPSLVLQVGTASLIVGTAITMLGVYWQQIGLMFSGTAIVGIGFGGNLSAILRMMMPLADRQDRAGLLSTFFVQSYLAFSLPAVGAGIVVPQLGLATTAYSYSAMVIALSLLSLVATRKFDQPA